MGTDITFIVHGTIIDPPDFGILAQYDLLPPTSEDLYKGRLEAMKKVSTPFFCILDGGTDRLTPQFPWIIQTLIARMVKSGAGLGVTKELPTGHVGHSAVVCNTFLAQKPNFPASGPYHFESMVYTYLKKYGYESFTLIPAYIWNKTPGSASTWPDIWKVINNSLKWNHENLRSL